MLAWPSQDVFLLPHITQKGREVVLYFLYINLWSYLSQPFMVSVKMVSYIYGIYPRSVTALLQPQWYMTPTHKHWSGVNLNIRVVCEGKLFINTLWPFAAKTRCVSLSLRMINEWALAKHPPALDADETFYNDFSDLPTCLVRDDTILHFNTFPL